VYIPATATVLQRAFEHAQYEPKKPFLTAVKGVRALTVFYGANHAIRFIKHLYLNASFVLTRQQTSGYLLAELFYQHAPNEVKAQLKAAISREFHFLPLAATELLDLIDSYPII
jgi:hypothetical protein